MSGDETGRPAAQGGSRRRNFFQSFLGRAVVAIDEMRGVRHFQLADLPALPDAALARIKPMVRPEVEIIVDDRGVLARRPGHRGREEAPVALFLPSEAHLFAFNRWNGRCSLGETASALESHLAWSQEASFSFVKGLFLHLLRSGVCVPGNPPEEPREPGGSTGPPPDAGPPPERPGESAS